MPAANPSAPAGRALDGVTEQLVNGALGFDAPSEMTQGTAVDVQVSVGTLRAAVGQAFPAGSKPTIEDQPLSAVMSVTLSGSGFDVTPPTGSRQAVSDSAPTTWWFSVLPTDYGGHQVLTMDVDAEVTVPGHSEAPKQYRTTREIDVKVSRKWMAQRFVGGNWQYLLSTLLVPLGVWAWKDRRKHPSPNVTDDGD